MKNKIVLFDIDHTLFNTVTFVDKIYEVYSNSLNKKAFYKLLEEIRLNHFQSVKEEGTIKSSIQKSLWEQASLTGNFYEETIEVLNKLSKEAVLGIFSKGNESYQKKKIESLLHFFDEDNIHIASDKDKILPEIIKKYSEYRIIIVDDILEILYQAKKLDNDVVTVLIKRPVYRDAYLANQQSIEGFTPDATITNLKEIIPIVTKDLE